MRSRRSLHRHRFTRFTDALIPVYNRLFEVLAGRRHEAFREHVLELAAFEGDECLLDAGCGTGMMALRIAARYPGCTVHGIDISPKMIAAARQGAERQGLAADFRVGSITGLPCPDASFDVAITNIMYHHLDLAEKRQAVAEIARVLKPGGRYVSAEFGPRARNALERRLAKGEYTLYPSHLTQAGLTIINEELGILAWGKQVFYRVAVKPAGNDIGCRRYMHPILDRPGIEPGDVEPDVCLGICLGGTGIAEHQLFTRKAMADVPQGGGDRAVCPVFGCISPVEGSVRQSRSWGRWRCKAV